MTDLLARFPERRLALALLRRGVLFWVLMRAMLFTIGMATKGSTFGPFLNPAASVVLVLTVGGLGVVESRRLNEHRFFANLGISPITAGVLVVFPSVMIETVLGIVAAR